MVISFVSLSHAYGQQKEEYVDKSLTDTVLIANSYRKTNQKYIRLAITESKFAVRDEATSPLIYKGNIPGLALGFNYFSPLRIFTFDYHLSVGYLTTRNYPATDKNKAKGYNNRITLNILYNLKPRSVLKTPFYLGFNIDCIGNIRDNSKLTNTSFNYEIFCALGPSFLYEKTLNLGADAINAGLLGHLLNNRKVKITAQGSLPLITAALRPSYIIINDFLAGERNIEPAMTQIVFLDKYFQASFELGFQYILHNRNSFKFSYQWYYYNFTSRYNPVNAVSGSLSFSFLFLLNNN
jgi:hypothetical protein